MEEFLLGALVATLMVLAYLLRLLYLLLKQTIEKEG